MLNNDKISDLSKKRRFFDLLSSFVIAPLLERDDSPTKIESSFLLLGVSDPLRDFSEEDRLSADKNATKETREEETTQKHDKNMRLGEQELIYDVM